ncbi:hypothetical protein [Saccharopolyspora mangrovi]|uniref:PH domain-containing protein n=1 Tax=Saccharopolyspora mangrovi TaxID=3082379 RepID=A0ABU6AJF6_9PSEU|nr:hypothetical protein [Saccharopolyspora sp. S2-29]MEB3371597.1 hypothetical protein [Saccharopolyspora sp. S2-29]
MPSSGRLEVPAEWPVENRGRFILAFGFLVVLGVLSSGVGLVAAGIAFIGATKYAVLLAGLFWLVAAFGYMTRLRPQHRGSDLRTTTVGGTAATEIRYSGAQFALINLIVACLLLCAGFAAWDYGSVGTVPMALAALAALFFASYFVLLALGRIRRGRVVLTAEGIRREGRAFESFLPWDSFVGAKPSYNGTREVLVVAYDNAPWEKRPLGGPWKLDKLPPVPMIEVDTVHLAVDPTLVFHLLRFYTENPSAREELGTDAVLRRVREQSF